MLYMHVHMNDAVISQSNCIANRAGKNGEFGNEIPGKLC